MDDQFEDGTRYRAAFLAALETTAGRILNGVAGSPNVARLFEESLLHAGADVGFQLRIPASDAVEFFMLAESPHRANEIVSGVTDIADEIVRAVAQHDFIVAVLRERQRTKWDRSAYERYQPAFRAAARLIRRSR